jgi:replicative DNA helicase
MNARTGPDDFDVDDATPSLRRPPHSAEAEQSVLGGLLLDNAGWDRIGDLLTDSDFFAHQHRLIWAAIGSSSTRARWPTASRCSSSCARRKPKTTQAACSYLNALSQSVVSAAGIRQYATVVREHAVTRSLISAADAVAALGFDPAVPSATKLDRAATMFADLQQGSVRSLPQSADKLIVRQLDHWNDLHLGNVPDGIPTGIDPLDEALHGGLRPGRVIVLAARPSVGKTALALQIAKRVALHQGLPTLVLSLEMEAGECMDRLASNEAGVPYEHLQTGKITGDEWTRLAVAAELIARRRSSSTTRLRSRSSRSAARPWRCAAKG